jgi:cathepsin L
MRSFVAAAITGLASAAVIDQATYDFVKYLAEQGKSYDNIEEFNLRAAVFAKFDAEVKRHNANETTSTHGHNFLSDMTEAEKARMMGLRNIHIDLQEPTPEEENVMPTYPVSVNWVSANKVNPIQNQGNCGSCWAFSAAACMESAHAIFHSTLYKLSEQNFVSCSSLQGNLGCNGGNYNWAWNYAKTNPVESEANYPYTSGSTGKTGSCTYDSAKGIGKVSSWTKCGTTIDAMKTCVAQQPNSVSIDAATTYFQSYSTGVLTNASACGTSLDHAVEIVGYGTDASGTAYWNVRNSWGTGWGKSGYVWIGISAYPGICGINEDPMWVSVYA